MDALSVVLVVALVAALSKDKLTARWKSFASKRNSPPAWLFELSAQVDGNDRRSCERHGAAKGELNHIKGQLQDQGQRLQTLGTSIHRMIQLEVKDPLANATAALQEEIRSAANSQEQSQAATANELTALSGRSLTLLNELSEIRTTLQILSEARQQPQDTQAADIYLKSLAGLADGINKTLERQEKIEKLLVQMVSVLNNKLTP